MKEGILWLSSIVFFAAWDAVAQSTSVPTVVPTFHCLGLYWSPADGSENNECEVQYRTVGSQQWQNALPLWFDTRDGEYRGSIVNLTPGTSYEIQLTLVTTSTTETITVDTWSESFPAGQTVYLPENSNQPLVIDQAGTPDGYILYTHAESGNATIDVNNNHDVNIEVTANAQYIIIRGLVLKGAAEHGIRLRGETHDIVIEENDISGWGNNAPDGWGINMQSAVFAGEDSNVERIIVQRNKMHHPRSDANNWEEQRAESPWSNKKHPMGPQAVNFVNSNGNHVIRYNSVYTDIDHRFYDIFGSDVSGSNFGFEGFPVRDTDIYGNYLQGCWDDGIESEGGNENVRIWGNYIDDTLTKIAVAATTIGPIYVWRNIAVRSRRHDLTNNSDSYGRSTFIKAGDELNNGKGRINVFHNTVLQPDPPANQSYYLGCRGGIVGSGGRLYACVSRNNIFTNYRNGQPTYKDNTNSCTNDLDYDLYNGSIQNDCSSRPHESHGIYLSGGGLPDFDPNNIDFVFDPNTGTSNGIGTFALNSGSPGIDDGVVIPNFNDDYTGGAPDIGAFEAGQVPMEFGVTAYAITSVDDGNGLPNEFRLSQNYPNPFNPSTTILYDLANEVQVTLRVYNLLGQEVTTLVEERQQAGSYHVRFDGAGLASGVYFYRLSTSGLVQTKKLVLLR